MYDFHKIKNRLGHHEFRHEKFKRGHVDDLKYIQRKISQQPETPEAACEVITEYNTLLNTERELENTLRTIKAQNRKLAEANRDILEQASAFRAQNESRVRKLIFIMMVLLNNYTEEFLNVARSALLKSGLLVESDRPNLRGVTQFVKRISHHFGFQSDQTDVCLDRLVELFRKHFHSPETRTCLQVSWNDLFAQSECDEEELSNSLKELEEDDEMPAPIVLEPEEEPFTGSPLRLDRFSQFDRSSAIEPGSNGFKDMELLGNVSRRISSLYSFGENVFENELNSLNLKSPRSEKSFSINFI